jgi:glycosyltransferase involved in cell wall biosynthesis
MSTTNPVFSIIVPVYNRPQEIRELLQSLTRQTFKDFEVLIVEDGSSSTSRDVVSEFQQQLNIQYFVKENEGPGPSRNFGFTKASGTFFVVFDSDCIIPEDYFSAVLKFMQNHQVDAWGGADRGYEAFTNIQRAMAFTMSSWITTGGIRGSLNNLKSFQPRSFNMGMRRSVFQLTGGFRLTHFAEDIELSIRMQEMGLSVWLIPDAWVYHKRRSTFSQFYKQVRDFGKGRIQVGRMHNGSIKLTHCFPSLFTLGLVALPVLLLTGSFIFYLLSGLYLMYFLIIGIIATVSHRSVSVGMLSVISAFIQLTGYGYGFLKEAIYF